MQEQQIFKRTLYPDFSAYSQALHKDLLHDCLRDCAKRLPNKTAFFTGKESISYAELDFKSSKLANVLLERGIQKGDRVGIFCGRSIESVIGVYAAMKAGGVMVPINPFNPAERSRLSIEDCDLRYLVTEKARARQIHPLLKDWDYSIDLFGLKTDLTDSSFSWEEILEASKEDPMIACHTDDMAYIMYTSGSTGIPKGIVHTHRSGISYANISSFNYDIGEDDIIGSHSPLHFDMCTMGYFTAPYVGASTLLVSEAHTKAPASLAQLIADSKVSVWYSVPLAMTQMLQNDLLATKDLSALRWFPYGGEPFPIKHAKRLLEQVPHLKVSNVYGPAETNQSTKFVFDKDFDFENELDIPIGASLPNSRILLFDENDQEVARGIKGECLIHTTNLMEGYWKQDKLNAECFYDHSDGKRYYRTGDLLSCDEKGRLRFHGRKDRQIKIHGYRIELGEVEKSLMDLEEVLEASVLTNKEGEEIELVAFLRCKSDYELNESEIFKKLRKKLPSHAIPKSCILLSEFPRTGSDKVDRNQLRLLL